MIHLDISLVDCEILLSTLKEDDVIESYKFEFYCCGGINSKGEPLPTLYNVYINGFVRFILSADDTDIYEYHAETYTSDVRNLYVN